MAKDPIVITQNGESILIRNGVSPKTAAASSSKPYTASVGSPEADLASGTKPRSKDVAKPKHKRKGAAKNLSPEKELGPLATEAHVTQQDPKSDPSRPSSIMKADTIKSTGTRLEASPEAVPSPLFVNLSPQSESIHAQVHKPKVVALLEPRFIHTLIECDSGKSIVATFIYASLSLQGRRMLWDDLRKFAGSGPQAWLLLGDFNAMTEANEKRGGANSTKFLQGSSGLHP
ncbi:hypothetical protein LINPERHAP1_LOCUS15701 [Linum perenne]